MNDIYLQTDYGRLYEEIEGGKCEVFEFKSQLGSIRHMFIKRKIPLQASKTIYYDLVTPYGYGGPIILECEEKDKDALVDEFKVSFQKYCKENNIVSEFVRFHPIISNAKDFKNCYSITHKSNTTGTTLQPFEDPVQEEFSKSTKKRIRKALKEGVTFKVTVNPENLRTFQDIYYRTMERIGAKEVYFFDDDYFDSCLEYFGEHIVLVEAIYNGLVIGTEMHFWYGDRLHTHLSGTLEEFHHLSPVYVMTYAIALWGKENGVELIHAGGGRTNDPEDSLFLFKKKFGKNTEFQYFIGHKIWDEDAYKILCEISGIKKREECAFPAYRKEILVQNA